MSHHAYAVRDRSTCDQIYTAENMIQCISLSSKSITFMLLHTGEALEIQNTLKATKMCHSFSVQAGQYQSTLSLYVRFCLDNHRPRQASTCFPAAFPAIHTPFFGHTLPFPSHFPCFCSHRGTAAATLRLTSVEPPSHLGTRRSVLPVFNIYFGTWKQTAAQEQGCKMQIHPTT